MGIYTDAVLSSYRGKNRLEVSPHVFAVAESAYYNMKKYSLNQCVIISGESGAGKTEAAKRIMQYIASVSGNAQDSEEAVMAIIQSEGLNPREKISDEEKAEIEAKAKAEAERKAAAIQAINNKVLATNPLLESFGNAKTLRNNNSSRFGKYLELHFNQQAEPIGATITNYLLEKSRVVGQVKNERSFHIFYQFAKGASEHQRSKSHSAFRGWRTYGVSR